MYKIYALRLGINETRVRAQNLLHLNAPSEAGLPMPQEFYAWVLAGEGYVILVDCGLPAAFSRSDVSAGAHLPLALADIGVATSEVTHIILSHAHWDHTGFLAAFDRPLVIMQRAELAFIESDAMRHPLVSRYYDRNVVGVLDSLRRSGRLRLLDGVGNITPGVNGVLVGGHTPGSQVVAVESARGCIAIASDAVPFYDNLRLRSPFPVLESTVAALDGFETVDALIGRDPERLIPGHDPIVGSLFRSCGRNNLGVVLHERPASSPWSAEEVTQ